MPVDHSPIANEPQDEDSHGFERTTPSRIAASFRAALSGGRTRQGQTRATGETFLERAKRAVRRDYRQFAGLQRSKPAKSAQKDPKVAAPGKKGKGPVRPPIPLLTVERDSPLMNSINRLRNTPSGDVPEVVQEANEDTQDSQSERNEVLRRAMERDAFWEAESIKINEEFKDHTFGPSRVKKNITRCFDLSKERIELRQAKENEKTWLFNQRENSS